MGRGVVEQYEYPGRHRRLLGHPGVAAVGPGGGEVHPGEALGEEEVEEEEERSAHNVEPKRKKKKRKEKKNHLFQVGGTIEECKALPVASAYSSFILYVTEILMH